jgi:DNA-binding transcriptional LysR family regulator
MAFDGKLLSGVTVLIAVVEAGTIARAAEALGLSPSGVSRALSRLEQRVGVRLLARTTRSLSLTDEGRRFYEQVGPHLAGMEEAAIEAGGSANKVRGRLRVNIDPFFSRIVLSRHLAAFLARYPDLSVELIMRDSVGDLVADGFDLALRFGEPPVGSFVARKLIETRVLTVASPSYIKAAASQRDRRARLHRLLRCGQRAALRLGNETQKGGTAAAGQGAPPGVGLGNVDRRLRGWCRHLPGAGNRLRGASARWPAGRAISGMVGRAVSPLCGLSLAAAPRGEGTRIH